jgi:hypothetical protein
VRDLDALDDPVTHLLQVSEQLKDGGFQREVAGGRLWPRVVTSAEFQCPNDTRCGIEDSLNVADRQVLNAPKVNRLDEPGEPNRSAAAEASGRARAARSGSRESRTHRVSPCGASGNEKNPKGVALGVPRLSGGLRRLVALGEA